MALHGLLLPLRKLSVNIKEVKSTFRREIVIWRLENSRGNNRNQLMIAQSIRMKGVHFKKNLQALAYFSAVFPIFILKPRCKWKMLLASG